ncbi:hypothetical protein L218DRAFT_899786 [Marasmius fiardii PR-910]|nr:hypothetical protein L218DRAFT_899786 [Marasmius fiardii PR-910]
MTDQWLPRSNGVMEPAELSRQVHLFCESAIPLTDLISSADEFVQASLQFPDIESISSRLDQELQSVYDEVVDHSPSHVQLFLALLFHLKSLLSPSSIIESWFDLVLRPALRLPKLSTPAVQQARDLVLFALCSDEAACQRKVFEFRRRLLDLYLLDAFNEGSGEDVMEWEELDRAEREKRAFWKSNLEEILLRFGEFKAIDLLNEINTHFIVPTSRLQLIIFLNTYISAPTFAPSTATILVEHPLMENLIRSLLLDASTTACTIGLMALTKLLPIFAVHTSPKLPAMLHQLFAVLARILCWKPRLISPLTQPELSFSDSDHWDEFKDMDTSPSLSPRQELGWQSLDLSFDGPSSSSPNCRKYFSFLYYLFPSNLIKFLRDPVHYFGGSTFESPYQLDWSDVLNETKIRSLSGYLFRRHIIHPMLIFQDADGELVGRCFWAKYDIPQIATEASMLDVMNISLAFRERLREDSRKTTLDEGLPPHLDRPRLLLQNMVETTALLKSGIDIETLRPTSHWSSAAPQQHIDVEHGEDFESSSDENSSGAPGIGRAISDLQRQVLLLRNELNFELWLARENVKHIGRLYQDHTVTQNAEVERQGLYNKLRNYRAQVVRLESELRENKEQMFSAKNKYMDWNNELQKKLRELRDEKKAWLAEAAQLRAESAKAADLFDAQGKLLLEASKEVFQLQTQKKETQHKIDRLLDYEKQIEQHMKIQTLWSGDFTRFNERGEELELVKSQNKQLQLRLQSLEATRQEIEHDNETYRRQIHALEHLSPRTSPRQHPFTDAQKRQRTTDVTEESYRALREQNSDLREEVEELRAMVEVLRGQVEGRRGLITEPRSASTSPLL